MVDKYSAALEAARKTILEDDEKEWRLVKKASGMTLSCRTIPDTTVKRYKVEAVINAPPGVVMHYTTPGPDSLRMHWDGHVKDMEIIEQLDDSTTLLRTVTHKAAKGLVASREFVDLSVREDRDGTLVSIGCSIDHPRTGSSSLVRAWNYPAAIFCHPVEGHEDRTKFVSILQSDLKGKLPTKLVETVIPTVQQRLITDLKKAINDRLADRSSSSHPT